MNDEDLKRAIVSVLAKFQNQPLADAAINLFGVLGYKSQKRLKLTPNSLAGFRATLDSNNKLDEVKACTGQWISIDFLFQLTDEEIQSTSSSQTSFLSQGAYNGAIINSYNFFAIELTRELTYTRTQLATITREINKPLSSPALVLFRHGETLTLAIIPRRLSKVDTGKDVLEKVTLIKDIQLTETHRAHKDILSDLSIGALHEKHSFNNFVELQNAWQKTLDTSALNKRFYKDLADWYFWALDNVKFPDKAPKDKDGRDSLSLIRLITRVIFVWFIKEKGLVPDRLFIERELKNLLKGFHPESSDSVFFRAILQNLFFATLNTETEKRDWTDDAKYGQNMFAHSLYRFKECFTQPDATLGLFSSIPFLNGGLFECLDKDLGQDVKPRYIRIDGFSRRPDSQCTIPDYLFFGGDRVVNLNKAYGDERHRAVTVKGLIHILDHYKFTVTENTPIEEEIALDPELLGKAFENLLASYNPETGATARKQTGSFYTPREIVNYMVDESLIASLKTKLETTVIPAQAGIQTDRTIIIPTQVGIQSSEPSEQPPEWIPASAGMMKAESLDYESRLRDLFTYNDQPHQFTPAEVAILIEAIDNLKVLDPACGSGAFPMGILHKLVFILGKLDSHNLKWKARQIDKALEIPDSTVREKVIIDIEESFKSNELDYGRKLYLIENCIYGVDIQPIAVQISKLRFFISLVVDQKVDRTKDNIGVRPLPNLETKFVAANTLIGITRPGQQGLRNVEIDKKQVELKKVRDSHFTARTPGDKRKHRERDAELREEIADLLIHDHWDRATATLLAGWNPYDQNKWADFFDLEWMFGVRKGFNVIIGNPPYINIEKISIEDKERFIRIYGENGKLGKRYDVYQLFIMKSITDLSIDGVLSLILPNTFLMGSSYLILRKRICLQTSIAQIIDLPQNVFENATVDNVIILLRENINTIEGIQINKLNTRSDLDRITEHDWDDSFVLSQQALTEDNDYKINVHVNPVLKSMFDKIENLSVQLGVITESSQGIIIYRTEEDSLQNLYTSFERHDGWKKLLRGTNIGLYQIKWGGEYLNYGNWLWCQREIRYFTQPKILLQAMRNKGLARRLVGTYDDEGYFNAHNLANIISTPDSGYSLKFILGIFNSSLINFWYRNHFPNVNINPGDFRQIPVIINAFSQQGEVSAIVEKITLSKKNNADTSKLERDLDQLVYSLYNLTPDEIRIVEEGTGKK